MTPMAALIPVEKVVSLLKAREKVALFLDYDGTLVHIRKDPSKCVLPDPLKTFLRKLAASKRFYPVIMSGRSLKNVRKMAGVRGICYGGNHGFDVAGPGLRYTHPAALRARPCVIRLKRLLKIGTRGIKGVLIEDKFLSISLHYRSVKEKDVPRVFRAFDEASRPFVGKKLLSLQRGKKVLELVPPAEWNKGFAVLWLLRRLDKGFYPVYIGDDLTDETAFRALKSRGLTLKVGESGTTSARYRLKGPGDVRRLLSGLAGPE